MWELYSKESWALKNCCFWTVKRLLQVPWPARRFNQSILEKINPEYSLKNWCWSWNSNTLATWCEVIHLKRPWCCEILKVGGEGCDRGWDGSIVSQTQWTWIWVSSQCWWWTGKPGSSWGQKHRQLSNWTILYWTERAIEFCSCCSPVMAII